MTLQEHILILTSMMESRYLKNPKDPIINLLRDYRNTLQEVRRCQDSK